MPNKNYQHAFTTLRTAEEVYEVISDVKSWWTRDMDGKAVSVGDVFTIHFDKLWKTMRVTEAVPGKRIAWKVLDCHMPFLKDVKEWKGTTMCFDIAASPAGTEVKLTHVGLTPDIECYEACEEGWGFFFGQQLPKLLNKARRRTSTKKAATVR